MFPYTTLTATQIRIIRLDPAQDPSDPLQGDIIVVGLDDLPPPRPPNSGTPTEPLDETRYTCFDAISYVWGVAPCSDVFFAPGGSIPLTPSLSSILRRLRRPSSPRLVWADAVCINQADVAEKETQIGLMGLVYGSAARVFCDLGEGADGAVLDVMDRYWRRNIRSGPVLNAGESSHVPGDILARVLDLALPTEEEAAAIEDVKDGEWALEFARLASSAWFGRLWTVQEFVLARDVVLLVGRRRVRWTQLWAGMLGYRGRMWPWYSEEQHGGGNRLGPVAFNSMCQMRLGRTLDRATDHGRRYLALVEKMGNVTNSDYVSDLPVCLIAFCSSGVTVPRDRYFAVLGLVDPELLKAAPELRPDYTSPLEVVTRRYWRYALGRPSAADLLNIAGIPGRVGDYPTWIRDITVSNPLEVVWVFGPLTEAGHTAGGSTDDWSARFFEDDPDRMFLLGHPVDDVCALDPAADGPPSDTSLFARIAQAFAFFTVKPSAQPDGHLLYHTGEYVHEAAWKTIYNVAKGNYDPHTFKLAVDIALVLAADYEGDDGWEKMGESGFFTDRVDGLMDFFTRLYATWGLQLAKTTKGYFAMVPKETRIGDSVWVIRGSRLPTVLRPSTTHPGSFDLVGGGYVHGFMNGEVMEAPGFRWRWVSLR